MIAQASGLIQPGLCSWHLWGASPQRGWCQNTPIPAQPEIILGCGSCGGPRDSPGSWIPPYWMLVFLGVTVVHTHTHTHPQQLQAQLFLASTHSQLSCCSQQIHAMNPLGAMEPPGTPTTMPGIAQASDATAFPVPQHSLPCSIPCPTWALQLCPRHWVGFIHGKTTEQ